MEYPPLRSELKNKAEGQVFKLILRSLDIRGGVEMDIRGE